MHLSVGQYAPLRLAIERSQRLSAAGPAASPRRPGLPLPVRSAHPSVPLLVVSPWWVGSFDRCEEQRVNAKKKNADAAAIDQARVDSEAALKRVMTPMAICLLTATHLGDRWAVVRLRNVLAEFLEAAHMQPAQTRGGHAKHEQTSTAGRPCHWACPTSTPLRQVSYAGVGR